MAEMISKVSSVISLCQNIKSWISYVQQTLYNNHGQECETLCKELLIMEHIHIDLRNRINNNNDARNSERGLLDAIQYTQTILEELLTAVRGPRLQIYQVKRRYELRKIIVEKTNSLHGAIGMVTYTLECSQYRPSNQSSSDAADNADNDITGNSEDRVIDGSGSETAELEADYGRLIVDVADDLTLDSCVKLATLFRLPPAATDEVRRRAQTETPGITLMNFLQTRNIINMYDVISLQRGLVDIKLNQTNENLLVPYQSKVDRFRFEEN